jgi:hypothetical protein
MLMISLVIYSSFGIQLIMFFDGDFLHKKKEVFKSSNVVDAGQAT